jgi:hypothetical protein
LEETSIRLPQNDAAPGGNDGRIRRSENIGEDIGLHVPECFLPVGFEDGPNGPTRQRLEAGVRVDEGTPETNS